jgi:catechol 2,3-dioxygenase-like lactoylglutathione lyase family enzyme
MITGMHAIIYTRNAEADRAFFRDVLGFSWVPFELGLFLPQEPVLDAATAHTMREMVAKGAMPPLVLVVDNCRAAYDCANGVEFIQEPIARFGGVDANFRDPSGNAWKMIEARS